VDARLVGAARHLVPAGSRARRSRRLRHLRGGGALKRSELDALAVAPREQLRAALERGPREAAACFARLDRGYESFERGFRAWIAAIFAWWVERHGADAAAADASFVLDAAQRHAADPADLAAGTDAQQDLERLASGALLARFDALEQRRRRSHDLYLDWVTELLSSVYRSAGPDELESCLRFTGERTLLRWMPRDLALPPERRVRRWAGMLLANFAQIAIEEDAEKFAICQERCGSCGRQLEAGSYGPAPRFAIVEEPHRVAFCRGGVPVYRTHVAVLHYLLPLERTGVPWPVVECPAGLAAGPCRLLIYKDPARTPRAHWDWLGQSSALASR
jgi:hypothetical protein